MQEFKGIFPYLISPDHAFSGYSIVSFSAKVNSKSG